MITCVLLNISKNNSGLKGLIKYKTLLVKPVSTISEQTATLRMRTHEWLITKITLCPYKLASSTERRFLSAINTHQTQINF